MQKTNILIKLIVLSLCIIPVNMMSQTLTVTELTSEEAYDAIGRYKEIDEQIESITLDAKTTYDFVLLFNGNAIYRESLEKNTKSYSPSITYNKAVGFCFKKNLLDSDTILDLIENNQISFGGKEKDYLCKTYFPIFKKEGSEYIINQFPNAQFESKIYKVVYND